MIKKILIILVIIVSQNSFSQEPILVTESTIVLSFDQSRDLYFSFAEGDIITLDVQMIKGKHIKQIAIVEEPSNIILTEYKVSTLNNKKINIRNKGVYRFRFYSSSLTRRVCKVKILRTPSSQSSKNFNTSWRWKTLRDTTYTPYQQDSLIAYKTIKYQETLRELKESKIEEIMLFEKSQKVHSYYNGNRSKTHLRVDLPILQNSPLREESLIAWSYWIGVGQEAQEAYKKNIESFSSPLSKVASTYYQTPLAGFAVGAISKLIIPQTGEDVQYYFVRDYENIQKFYNNQQFLQFDMGKGRAAYGRNDRLKEGTFYIGLSNDNETRAIEVNVKVLAVKEIKIYENIIYDRERQEPQYVTLNKERIDIQETKVRIPAE